MSAGTYYRGPGEGRAEADAARLFPAIPGWHVIFAHRNRDSGLVEVLTETGIQTYNEEEFADEVERVQAAAGKPVLLLMCYAGHVADADAFAFGFRNRRDTPVVAVDGVVWITGDGVLVRQLAAGVMPTDPDQGDPGGFLLYPAAMGQLPIRYDELHRALSAGLPDRPPISALPRIPVDTPAHFMLPGARHGSAQARSSASSGVDVGEGPSSAAATTVS